MASDDVGLKLCQQHVIKLDFEIKAVIQVCWILHCSVCFMSLCERLYIIVYYLVNLPSSSEKSMWPDRKDLADN